MKTVVSVWLFNTLFFGGTLLMSFLSASYTQNESKSRESNPILHVREQALRPPAKDDDDDGYYRSSYYGGSYSGGK